MNWKDILKNDKKECGKCDGTGELHEDPYTEWNQTQAQFSSRSSAYPCPECSEWDNNKIAPKGTVENRKREKEEKRSAGQQTTIDREREKRKRAKANNIVRTPKNTDIFPVED